MTNTNVTLTPAQIKPFFRLIEAYEHSPDSSFDLFVACEQDFCDVAKEYLRENYGCTDTEISNLEEQMSEALLEQIDDCFNQLTSFKVIDGYKRFSVWLVDFVKLNPQFRFVLRNAFLGAFQGDARLLSQAVELYMNVNKPSRHRELTK